MSEVTIRIEQLELHIESLTDERRERWRRNLPVNGLAEELDAAWTELRYLRSVAVNGPAADIVKQARVERELEKLMTE